MWAFGKLTVFERILWIASLIVVTLSFVLSPNKDYLTLIASLIGVTALIFVAKGFVLGQILSVVFAVFYGIISVYFRYYGEMITYLFMTTPMAIAATVEWIKNPYKDTKEVTVKKITKREIARIIIVGVMVTIAFYFILKALDTANLVFSTLSITTSFVASYLTKLRSAYYGIAYGANDIVLIILWILATIQNIAYLPMVFCFIMFLINDIYGFINWKRIENRQKQ